MVEQNGNVKQIVVFAPNKKFFGANILQIPFFQHLREGFPNARITVWSPEKASSMMLKLDLADELFLYTGWKDYARIFRILKKLKPEIIFNLRKFSEGINLLTGLSQAKLRIGFTSASPTRFFLNRRIQSNDHTYMALYYLDLLKEAGMASLFFFDGIKRLENGSGLKVPEKERLVCLFPGGGEGEHKKWGIHNYCKLGKMILKSSPKTRLVFILGPGEITYTDIISGYFNESDYMLLVNGSIPDLVRISRRAILAVANDCGPAHIAQMTGGNYIGIWGWKNQHPLQRIINWTYPKPNSVHIVANPGKDIKQITPEEVFQAARGFLLPDEYSRKSAIRVKKI